MFVYQSACRCLYVGLLMYKFISILSKPTLVYRWNICQDRDAKYWHFQLITTLHQASQFIKIDIFTYFSSDYNYNSFIWLSLCICLYIQTYHYISSFTFYILLQCIKVHIIWHNSRVTSHFTLVISIKF